MLKEKLATLWAYITNQEEIIDAIYLKLHGLQPENDEKIINKAYHLHNLYSAYEDMFKEISETFENNIERSSGYHKNLLIRMKIAIPGIRPNVISNQCYNVLGELMAFRHVFRHAYNYNLATDKMQLLRNKIIENQNNIKTDINYFKQFLEQNFKSH